MRAVVVLPTPRTPVSIQACGMRFVSKAFESVRTITSWPIRSSKVRGRYFRASTRYAGAATAGAGGAKPGKPGSSVGGVPVVVSSIGDWESDGAGYPERLQWEAGRRP